MVGYSKLPMMLDFSGDSLEFSGDSLELNVVQQQQNSSKQSNKDVIGFSEFLEFSFSMDSIKTTTNTDRHSSIGGDVSEGEWCLGNFKSFVGDCDSLDIPEWFQPMSSSSSVAADLGDVASIGEVTSFSILSSSSSAVGDGNDAVLAQKSSSLLNLLEDGSLSLASMSMSFDSLDGISGK